MRVLITNTGPWGTGSGAVAEGLMKELKRRGHQVMAFFPDTGFPSADHDKYYKDEDTYRIAKFPTVYSGVDLYTFPLIITDPNPRNYQNAWTFKDLTKEELAAYLDYMRENLQQVITDFHPDVIECQHIWALDHLIAGLNYHYACTAHHSDQLGFIFDERMREVATKSAIKSDYIFAISDYVKEEVLDLYGVDHQKVIITGNGYDQAVFKPLKGLNRKKVLAAMGQSDLNDYPIITFCGKMSHTKGVDVLLKANHLIQKKQKVYILLMGSGSLESFSKEERASFCLENVIILGQRSHRELALLHNLAVLSVLPSRTEGFGIAALEAMGCKKPVVVTRVGGLSSFAKGKIVEPEDEIELAEAILEILAMNNQAYQEVCNKAYSTALKYSWEKIVDIRMPYYFRISELNHGKILLDQII